MAAFSKFFDAIIQKFREGDDEWEDIKEGTIREFLDKLKASLTTALGGPSLGQLTKANAEAIGMPPRLWEEVEAVQASEQKPGTTYSCFMLSETPLQDLKRPIHILLHLHLIP
jgi:hypothetical protein